MQAELSYNTWTRQAPELITGWHLNRIQGKGHIYQETNRRVPGSAQKSVLLIVISLQSMTSKSRQFE